MVRKPAIVKQAARVAKPKSKSRIPNAKVAKAKAVRPKAVPSLAEVEELRARLEIADETLRAIQQGEVDGLVVSSPEGSRTYTLQGADHAYRALVETMNAGALTVDSTGVILYANCRMADLLCRPLETILGARLQAVVAPADVSTLESLLQAAREDQPSRGEINLMASPELRVPVLLSASPLDLDGVRGIGIVLADLSLQKRTEAALREAQADLEAKVQARTKELSQTVEALSDEINQRRRAEEIIQAQTQQLQVQNEELTAQQEELQAQNEELRLQQEELQQTEAALRESEARLRAILDNSPDPIFLKDRVGRLVLANPATLAVIGKPAEAVIGKTDAEFYDDPTTGRTISATDQRIMASGQMEVIEESVTIGAITRLYLSTKAPFRDAKGQVIGLIGVARDITDRKRAQEALRESEEKYRTIVETSGEGIVLALPDGPFTYANQRMAEMLGYTVDELLHKSALDLAFDGERPLVWQIRDELRQGARLSGEFKFRRKDGSALWSAYNATPLFNAQGEHVANLAMHTDITERRRAEEALRESEARFRTIAEAVPALVCITRLADAVVLFTNEVNNKAFGMRGVDIVGTKGPDYYWDSADRLKMLEQFRAQGFVDNYQLKVKRSDGTPFWIMTTVRPVSFQGQAAIIGASLDITDYKRTEEALRQARDELEVRVQERTRELEEANAVLEEEIEERRRAEVEIRRLNEDLQRALAQEQATRQQLVQAEKLGAMGRMVGSVAHELNNPLQTINNCLYLTNEELPPDSPIHSYLEMAQAETQRLVSLVAQLRELYRLRSAGASKAQRLDSLLQEVQALMALQLSAGHVRWRQPAEFPLYHVPVIQDGLKQVFINLVMNAIEAMQPQGGGDLTVDVKLADEHGQVAISLRDTGPGVAPEHLARLFEPFFTTKDHGLGLGLPICYEIVQQHGGRIAVESSPGQGAQFTVWLPIATQDQA